MIVLHALDEYALGASAVALGMFDGVHAGHARLLSRAVELARRDGLTAVALTFQTHPLALLRPEAAPEALSTRERRAERMAELGVDCVIELPFTREFSEQSPEDFAKLLLKLSPKVVVMGYNYSFGRRGAGTPAQMRAFGEQNGFAADVVAQVVVDGEPVSSTRVRELLNEGDAERAARLLGAPYAAPLAHGRIPEGLVSPMDGAYEGELDGNPARFSLVGRQIEGAQAARVTFLRRFTGDGGYGGTPPRTPPKG